MNLQQKNFIDVFKIDNTYNNSIQYWYRFILNMKTKGIDEDVNRKRKANRKVDLTLKLT